MTTTPPVPPAQAGEALTDEQYRQIIEGVLSPQLLGDYRHGDLFLIDPSELRAIIDKACAAGRQHAPAEPVKEHLIEKGYFAGCKFYEDPNLPPDTVEMRGANTVRMNLATGEISAAQPVQGLPDLPIIAYASSTRPNYLMSAAQYDNCLPKNRTAYDIPLVAAKGQSQDGLSHRDSGSTADASDTERLDFIEKQEATWYPKRHSKDIGILCYELTRTRGEALGRTFREAIDNARAAIEAERKQKGGE
jgi:hypothetical protein